eukprot:CAMPEP_0194041356 /NCGR_PEP_ID=MMETSP0009_2-20130614/13276_1 /TAXON_ID=210454 /ORGANISM="Grammatophora oceanica, Strain CCMP 410" /LENGTH=605 /DNA_ID=CAMNT_0038684837 /DNA_START=75 /DNA_END=1892 /DNA_ORIENTATION=+
MKIPSHSLLTFLSSLVLATEGQRPQQRQHQLRRPVVVSTPTASKSKSKIISLPITPHHQRVKELNGVDPTEDQNEAERGQYRRRRRRRLDRPAMPYSGDIDVDDEDGEEEEEEDSVAALYQGYGTHYVDLWVGTPPQRQTVIVDTGSSITAFPCQDCANCGTGYHVDQYFEEDKSSTFEETSCSECMLGSCAGTSARCEVSVSYQEGSSWRAYEASDLLYSGGPHDEALEGTVGSSFRMHFGCQSHLTGLFKTQLADGIMGMEMAETSFWYQMHQGSEAMEEEKFSLCFTRASSAEKKGTSAGAMTIGGTDDRLHETKMVFAEQTHKHGWFTVRLTSVYLRTGGGITAVSDSDEAAYEKVKIDSTKLNNGEVIIDSGTTDTYLTTRLRTPFEEAWLAVVGKPYSNSPMSLTEEEVGALPTVLFQVAGWEGGTVDPNAPNLVGDLDETAPNDILVAMPPTHYMEYSKKEDAYTSRLYFNEGSGGVLGANFMMGHDILFDVENGRVGFSESSCEYSVISDNEETGEESDEEAEEDVDDEEEAEEGETETEEEAEEGETEEETEGETEEETEKETEEETETDEGETEEETEAETDEGEAEGETEEEGK